MKFVAIAVALLALMTTWASAEDRPIGSQRLRVKAAPEASLSKVLFNASKQPNIVADVDPATVETSFELTALDCSSGACVPTEGSGRIVLDPAHWSGRGVPAGSKGYRYLDRTASSGGVRSVRYKDGRLRIRVRGTLWPWSPSGPVDSVLAEFVVGTDRYCAVMGGTAKKNEAERVLFVNAPNPGACPMDYARQGEPCLIEPASPYPFCEAGLSCLGVVGDPFGSVHGFCYPVPLHDCTQVGGCCETLDGSDCPAPGQKCLWHGDFAGVCGSVACSDASDCLPGETCEGGTCCGGAGQPCSGPSGPFAAVTRARCSAGLGCVENDGVTGVCVPVGPICGNGVRDAGEACDGADATSCPGLCQSDCSCPAPVCGNSVIELGESCEVGVPPIPVCLQFGLTDCSSECFCCDESATACSAFSPCCDPNDLCVNGICTPGP